MCKNDKIGNAVKYKWQLVLVFFLKKKKKKEEELRYRYLPKCLDDCSKTALSQLELCSIAV